MITNLMKKRNIFPFDKTGLQVVSGSSLVDLRVGPGLVRVCDWQNIIKSWKVGLEFQLLLCSHCTYIVRYNTEYLVKKCGEAKASPGEEQLRQPMRGHHPRVIPI
jgi:hypothetical protein